ncbi:MAG: hypothetical protein AAF288_14110 [Planctomycetota bacterium]
MALTLLAAGAAGLGPLTSPPAAAQDAPVIFIEDTRLQAAAGASGDLFGVAVGLDNGRAFIGTPFDSAQVPFGGSVYVYNTATGAEIARLVPDDLDAFDWFGHALAVDGDRVLAGAWRDDDQGERSGSAYVFDLATGDPAVKLVSPLPNATESNFAHALGLHTNTALVGAPRQDQTANDDGAAYLYDLASSNTPITLAAPAPSALDGFGTAVAVNNDFALVSALFDDTAAPDAGAVHVFDPTTGGLLGTLSADDAQTFDQFGAAIAIENNLAAVGARGADLDDAQDAGAVYLFDLNTFTQIGKLTVDDALAFDELGAALDIDNGQLIVSTRSNGAGPSVGGGKAYVFDLATQTQTDTFLLRDDAGPQTVGGAVAIDNGQTLLGLARAEGAVEGSGRAELFDRAFLGDANHDGAVDLLDFDILAGNFGQPGVWEDAEFSRNGVVDLLDFDAVAQYFGFVAPGGPPATAVPTPGVAALLAPGFALAHRRRRRRKAQATP